MNIPLPTFSKQSVEHFCINSVIQILGEKTQYITISPQTNLSLLDSIEIFELVSLIEKNTDITIEQEMISQIKTLGDLIHYITERLNTPFVQSLQPTLTDTQESPNSLSTSNQSEQNQLNLESILRHAKSMRFKEKSSYFAKFLQNEITNKQLLLFRKVLSVQDRTITVLNPNEKKPKELLMFGSNNYLGLSNHPYIKEKAHKALNQYGTGMTGSPLLNGYAAIAARLEEKLADLKRTESAMLFSSGYNANVGVLGAILQNESLAIADELIHASLIDGIKLAHKPIIKFSHNNVENLQELLIKHPQKQLFTIVEGVYSMDGDICPLDKIVSLSKTNNSLVVLDDAHGLGVLGKNGRGTAELYDVESEIDITVGTFSKALAQIGGFACADKAIIDYLRFYARSYMFSCALPPAVIAGIDAALDIMQKENWRITNLQKNIDYLKKQLNQLNIDNSNCSAIFAIFAPTHINVRTSLIKFDELGIFLNSVEYPAVPHGKERFRISLNANHTLSDLDRLIEALIIVMTKDKL
ncbi:TPA: aminotransferase class I/II-fold pyridoxal phosphate-dependent enzyme [Legionella anisa]